MRERLAGSALVCLGVHLALVCYLMLVRIWMFGSKARG